MKIKVTERLKKGITIEYGKRTNKMITSIGGQALMEGVMMRGRKDFGGSSAS